MSRENQQVRSGLGLKRYPDTSSGGSGWLGWLETIDIISGVKRKNPLDAHTFVHVQHTSPFRAARTQPL
jgi:hypothetical protein